MANPGRPHLLARSQAVPDLTGTFRVPGPLRCHCIHLPGPGNNAVSAAQVMVRSSNQFEHWNVLLCEGRFTSARLADLRARGYRRADAVMDIAGVTPHPFRMLARVPEDMVTLPPEGEWAAWSGISSAVQDGRDAVVVVSITVTAFDLPPAGAPGEVLAARLRARYPEGTALIQEFSTPEGNPAVALQSVVTQRLNRRDVTTGQAQVLVAYASAGALGVVSGIALDPADLDRAAALVAGIATRMTVTVATAAA